MATICKGCGGEFSWQMRGRRWRLIDLAGKIHRCFAYRKPKPLTIICSRNIGADYRPSCGKCGLPPWQACMCSEIEGAVEEINRAADERFERMLDLLDA